MTTLADLNNIPQHGEGKYELISLTMSAPGGRVIDLAGQVQYVNVYESILAPSIIAEFGVQDGVGLFDSIDFTNQEVCIAWTSNPEGKEIHYRLMFLEVNPRTTTSRGETANYVIKAISEEAVYSTRLKDFQFVRKKFEPYQAVSMILDACDKDVKKKKNRYFDKTKGLHSFNFTNINPFAAIDKIRAESISDRYESSSFVFFENRYGYFFKTIESLIDEGKKQIGDKKFFYTPAGGLDPTGTLWRNIIAMKTVQQAGGNLLMATGGGRVRVEAFNSIKKKADKIRDAKITDFDFVKMNEGTEVASAERAKDNTQEIGRVVSYTYNPEEEQNEKIDKIAALNCFVAEFLSVVHHITIYGDSEISVGDVITLNIDETSGLQSNENKESSSIMSGNYLVAKVRHALTMSDTPEYYMALEVIKDGVFSNPQPMRIGTV